MTFDRLKKFFHLPFLVWVIILSTLISRLGTSMVIPYMTTLLVLQKHIALYWTGIAIGGSYLMQALSAMFGGRIYSKHGPIAMIKGFTILYSFVLAILGISMFKLNSKLSIVLIVIACYLLMGVCRSMIETIGQAIIGQKTPAGQKAFAFSLRYTFINIGNSLGPVIGFITGLLNSDWVFFMSALLVLGYLPLLIINKEKNIQVVQANYSFNFKDCLKLFLTDKKLYYFTLANFFVFIGFCQIESLFALVSYVYTGSSHVFAIMYVTSCLSIVFLQIPLVGWSKKFNIYYVLTFGVLFIAIGLWGIAIAAISHITLLYYLSAFVFTLGEIFTLSIMSIYVELIAAPDLRYQYFSVNNLSMFGRVFGPMISSVICYYFGLVTGLFAMGAITMLALAYIYAASKMQNNSHE